MLLLDQLDGVFVHHISPVNLQRAAARPVRRRVRSPSISPVSSNRAAARPVRRRLRSPSTSPRLRHGFRSSSVMPHNDAQLEEVFITLIFLQHVLHLISFIHRLCREQTVWNQTTKCMSDFLILLMVAEDHYQTLLGRSTDNLRPNFQRNLPSSPNFKIVERSLKT